MGVVAMGVAWVRSGWSPKISVDYTIPRTDPEMPSKFQAVSLSLTVTLTLIVFPANAATSRCRFQGAPAANCKITLKDSAGGWTKEYLEEPNGTLRIISREVRGDDAQINLYAPGQSRGSFHQGTYTKSANIITISVDGGRFSYALPK